MCNCNSKRAGFSGSAESKRRNDIKVTLLSDKPQVIHGNITGRIYVFRNKDDFNWIDRRDVIGLEANADLRTWY